MLDELRALANDLAPREVIDAIVRESGMGDALRAENTDEAYSRLENLGELASAASQYDTLMDFVERMALVADSDQLDGGAGAISMMTLHVAKGLEFPAVVITGLEETIFPHRRALSDDNELEEERRLCYVGITRAMRHLVLTHAWRRTMWGHRVDALASRFLQEIPSELIHDISSDHAAAANRLPRCRRIHRTRHRVHRGPRLRHGCGATGSLDRGREARPRGR